MNRLLEAWETLLREATSRDFDTQQNAVFQISLVLERHSGGVPLPNELYEENLSRELLRLTLDDKRQLEAVDFLAAMVRANDATAESFLYALGKAKPALAIDVLLTLCHERGAAWDDGAAYEAVSALLTFFKRGEAVVVAALRDGAPLALLAAWAERDDALLASTAKLLLDKLGALQRPPEGS